MIGDHVYCLVILSNLGGNIYRYNKYLYILFGFASTPMSV